MKNFIGLILYDPIINILIAVDAIAAVICIDGTKCEVVMKNGERYIVMDDFATIVSEIREAQA